MRRAAITIERRTGEIAFNYYDLKTMGVSAVGENVESGWPFGRLAGIN